ncbi:MAG: archaemetzincin family Zn-dependent metalloprotease, partial [bacterium]|nr:archaemetzincin family Zn-dependent metalloprotease [bacterium]
IFFSARQDLLKELVLHLEELLDLEVALRRAWFDPEASFDSSRGQYNSTQLLTQLLSDRPESATKILGITSVDLFIPVLTYVFGQAQVDGPAAIVSIQRLRNEAYGLPADDELLAERLKKEAVHELGHTFGLVHCLDPQCVMHASTYVEEIDLKTTLFCSSCLTEVRGRRGGETR